jgi:hypothetical protein
MTSLQPPFSPTTTAYGCNFAPHEKIAGEELISAIIYHRVLSLGRDRITCHCLILCTHSCQGQCTHLCPWTTVRL